MEVNLDRKNDKNHYYHDDLESSVDLDKINGSAMNPIRQTRLGSFKGVVVEYKNALFSARCGRADHTFKRYSVIILGRHNDQHFYRSQSSFSPFSV